MDDWIAYGEDDWVAREVRARGSGFDSMRLTRRGRLFVSLMATCAVLALAVMLATSVDAAATRIDHASTVLTGQTLSEVAATQLPSLPMDEAVAQIQLANGMSTTHVHAGQTLLIPAMR